MVRRHPAGPDPGVRARQPEWLYTYLRTFYKDDSRPYGVNNKVFKDVGMPHVLLELAGYAGVRAGPGHGPQRRRQARPLTGEDILEDPAAVQHQQGGLMTPEEFDGAVYDLVNFLAYMAEPMAADRQRIGTYVLLFIALFLYLHGCSTGNTGKTYTDPPDPFCSAAALPRCVVLPKKSLRNSPMGVVAKRSSMTFSPITRASTVTAFASSGGKGVTVDLIEADAAHPPAELADLNPYNSLPTLVDRELVLYESKVMMEYLDERFPHPPLLPVYPVARAESRLYIHRIEKDWCSLVDSILHSRSDNVVKKSVRNCAKASRV